ncbi:antibiotic biosynthesis monooxygenase [Paraburkholderia phymatum]|uniref:Antibiotic biosynthesis monooxygenase n=1 Tax=Paraburkholderia phymatum (strain DSM 17167 / CIP 108236 / LMG 21445 / STM815) TaxID=391038 RepID=B2JPA1_PARP8|nr:antibiotic biosynthesis monooxygenase [Paraburkholderia phymatum]ACC73104.1 Antibiotic biosynthesis monooxygenase [Paraburkholderia phymatum STM815]
MFSVLFEVQPRADRRDTYLDYAKMLKPELEQIDGFVDNVRYGSLTREGWLLSLSNWRDEKALVRWRTQATHHGVQEKARSQTFRDYRLRVGQLTRDTRLPAGCMLHEQRLDETQTGDATTIVLVDAQLDADRVKHRGAREVSGVLGLRENAAGLVAWDAFDAVLTPGDVMLLTSWRDAQSADAFANTQALPEGARLRTVRVVRDYGMYDRREAPQYYPDATRPE